MNLGDELYLLALDEKTGKIHPAANLFLDFGLDSILLQDLVLHKKIVLEHFGARIIDRTTTNDELLDATLDHLDRWKISLTFFNAHSRVRSHLLKNEVLEVREKGLLGPNKVAPKDAAFVDALKRRVRDALAPGTQVNEPTKRLCFFANMCHLLPILLEPGEIATARLKIRSFTAPPIVFYNDKEVMSLWSEAQKAYVAKNLDRFFVKAFAVFEKVIEKEYCNVAKKLAKNAQFHEKVKKLHDEGLITEVNVNTLLEIRNWRNMQAHDGEDINVHRAEIVYNAISTLIADISAQKNDLGT